MAELTLVRRVHPDPACSIALPEEFDAGTAAGVLLAARAPDGLFSSSPFAPNLTLGVQPLLPGADREQLSVDSLALAQRTFNAWRLIDREETEIAGLEGERTLATYLVRPGSGVELGRDVVVAVEQWRLHGEGLMWTISCSCESGDYGQLSDLWNVLAESFEPGEAE
jgi:hypothetical protein